jgi:hypothetical protein
MYSSPALAVDAAAVVFARVVVLMINDFLVLAILYPSLGRMLMYLRAVRGR